MSHILHQGDTFESSNTGKQLEDYFSFNCNIRNVYLLTCKMCKKQYVGSTITKFKSRFNYCKSNVKLYGKGQRCFIQEPLTEHFFSNNHHGFHNDIKVHAFDYCDLNHPECGENIWICHQDTTFPGGLNTRKLVLWKLVL